MAQTESWERTRGDLGQVTLLNAKENAGGRIRGAIMKIHCDGWLQLKNDGVFDVLFVIYDTGPVVRKL
jgi:hypothetical protein